MASSFQLGFSQSSTAIYHVHLSTHQEEFLFGDVSDEQTRLNSSGQIVADEWQRIAVAHQRDISLDHWTVLPNGIRALIAIDSNQAQQAYIRQSPPKPRALSSFVAGFKAAAAKRINLVRGIPGVPVWQRGYQEQRIDDPHTLARVRQLLNSQAQAAGLLEAAPSAVPEDHLKLHFLG